MYSITPEISQSLKETNHRARPCFIGVCNYFVLPIAEESLSCGLQSSGANVEHVCPLGDYYTLYTPYPGHYVGDFKSPLVSTTVGVQVLAV